MKLNISFKGHFSYLGLKDNIEMLKELLLDCSYNVEVSNNFKENSVNLIYEGHHPNNYNEVLSELKKNNSNKILICTEELTSNPYLPKSFFTFNNHEINRYKYRNEYFKSFYKLLSLNIRIKIFNYLTEKNFIEKINKYFPDLDIFKFLKLKNEDLQWKERYDFFYKTLNYYKGFISTYDKKNYKDLKFSNFLFLPHLFSKKDIMKKNLFDIKKEFDVIFTGQLNNYRETFLVELKKKFKLKILNLADDKERKNAIEKSKILIGLFKSSFQNLSSTNRTYYCIKNRILLLNQKPLVKDHLDNEKYIFHENEAEEKINYILLNYEQELKNYEKFCEKTIIDYQAKNFQIKLKNFFCNALDK